MRGLSRFPDSLCPQLWTGRYFRQCLFSHRWRVQASGFEGQYSYYPTSADERLQTITNLGPGTSGTLSQFSYGYDAAGEITSWLQQTGTYTSPYQYGYDGAGQLLRATIPNAGQSPVDAYAYRYDPAGNRTTEQINSAVTSSTYDSLNQLTSLSGSGSGFLSISGFLNKSGTVGISGVAYVTDSNNAPDEPELQPVQLLRE